MKILDVKSFTIMEIIVVLVIVGAIAGFGIPSYTRSMERSFEQEAINNLQMIHAANSIHRAREGVYWPPDAASHDNTEINDELSLNIIENGMTYTCTSPDPGNQFTCTGVRTGGPGVFTVTVTEVALSGTNPECTSGACP